MQRGNGFQRPQGPRFAPGAQFQAPQPPQYMPAALQGGTFASQGTLIDPGQLIGLQRRLRKSGRTLNEQSFLPDNPNNVYDDLDEVRKAEEEEKGKEAMTQLMTKLGLFLDGRGTPAVNMSQQEGFNISGNPAQLQRNTMRPLPFDAQLASSANLMGIVNSLSPEMYENNENIRQVIVDAAPDVARTLGSALNRRSTIYVPGGGEGFYDNRMNIYRQRKRETSVYAFT